MVGHSTVVANPPPAASLVSTELEGNLRRVSPLGLVGCVADLGISNHGVFCRGFVEKMANNLRGFRRAFCRLVRSDGSTVLNSKGRFDAEGP